MKNLIRTILKEYISNEKLMDVYISEFIRDLKNNVPDVYADVDYSFGGKRHSSSIVEILNYDERKYSSIIAKIIRKWKEKLSNYGIVVGSQESHSNREEYGGKMFYVSFKNMTTKRIKPNRFVFHASEVDPSIIYSEGLKPKSSDEGKWTHYNLAYPSAVFAGNTYDNAWGGKNIYIIDTTIASNSWWYDLNEFREDNLDYGKGLIMTFEPVSPDAIVGKMTYREFFDIIKASADQGDSKKEIESKIEDFLRSS